MALKGNHKLFLELVIQGAAPRDLVLPPLKPTAKLPQIFAVQAQRALPRAGAS